MCGILAVLRSSAIPEDTRRRVLFLSKRLRHRGPDWNGIHVQHTGETANVFAHERLAIVDPESGKQPLFDDTKQICVTVNGEIYNHLSLLEALKRTEPNLTMASHSDCAVIPFLYREFGEHFVSMLDGMFAFVIGDESTGEFMAARDPFGICPLYIGYATDGSVWISSEFKALMDDVCHFEVFPPGCFYSSRHSGFQRYFNPLWYSESSTFKFSPFNEEAFMDALQRAVEKRMMADVPYGVLLSGGLDSSIIAYLVNRKFQEMRWQSGSTVATQFRELHTFSIGMAESPDTLAARKVAASLNTVHHEILFNFQEGLDALQDVIYHLESYDVTTVRAATPLFLLARLIKSYGIKMVFSGEGSDEIFGGYLYFRKAPNAQEMFNETRRKVKALHLFDLLRANKAALAWGVEVRVPFMDKDFVNLVMQLNPQEKMHTPQRIEKFILRRQFAAFLPEDIVWRQKEQFSDGVGYSWIDGLKEHAEKQVTDHQLSLASYLFPHNPPQTKEAYYFRTIFHQLFPHGSASSTVPGGPSIACSSAAAIDWDESFKNNADQSGRAVIGVHKQGKRYF